MRVACFQPGVAGLPAGDAWRSVLERCDSAGARLLVTPEFAVGGLPHSAEAAHRTALSSYARLLTWAAPAPRDLTLLLGFTERAAGGLHSSVAVIRDRQVLAIARKVHPREPGLVPGEGSPVFTVGSWRCGIVICADATRPQPATALRVAGARLLLCPLNNDMSVAHAAQWREPTYAALSARARETGCWVVSADVAGEGPGRRALAATRVVAPTGALVATTAPEPGALLLHDIGRMEG